MDLPTRLKLLIITLFSLFVSSAFGHGAQPQLKGVIYDGRSLIVNGKRELLFSGSIHYPRSTPEVLFNFLFFIFIFFNFQFICLIGLLWWFFQMWPDLIAKAKHGGLNVIQTYVFWNVHEPVQGQVVSNSKYIYIYNYHIMIF